MLSSLATTSTSLMRTISESLRYPVIIVLLILVALSIFMVGTLIAEIFTEHRHLNVVMPKLVDEIRSSDTPLDEIIEKSGLLKSQKQILLEITKHPELNDEMLEALATRLMEEESSKYEKRVMVTDLMAKLGPMFGLLGTLIPLGPGIIALGQKDTYTLSQSLLVAFDTTVLGLITAAVALVISTIRKKWYRNYMSILNTLTECVLEVVEERPEDEACE